MTAVTLTQRKKAKPLSIKKKKPNVKDDTEITQHQKITDKLLMAMEEEEAEYKERKSKMVAEKKKEEEEEEKGYEIALHQNKWEHVLRKNPEGHWKSEWVESTGSCTCHGQEGSLCSKCMNIPLDCPCMSLLGGISHTICYNRRMEKEEKIAKTVSEKKKKEKEEKKKEEEKGTKIGWEKILIKWFEEGKKIKRNETLMDAAEDNLVCGPDNKPGKSPVQHDSDDETPVFPPEFTIFQRGKETATQCYWSLVIDAIVAALVVYCKEACVGCRSNSRKKHTLCDLSVKTVWDENRDEILARVDINVLVGKWATVVYSCCGVRPSEAESLFALCDPNTMLQGWQVNPHPPVKIMGYNMYDEERDYWRSQTNQRMAKIEHPARYCSFDVGLISNLDQQRKSKN